MNTELLIDEIVVVLAGEHDTLDSAVGLTGLTEFEVYNESGTGFGSPSSVLIRPVLILAGGGSLPARIRSFRRWGACRRLTLPRCSGISMA